MIFRQIKKFAFAIFAIACASNALGDIAYSPIELHKNYLSNAMPIAVYKNIKIDDFKKLIVMAFEGSNFSLVSITETRDQDTLYKFSYPISFDEKLQNINLILRTNETKDSKKRCADCFLRIHQKIDDANVKTLPWMTQYELSSKFFPDIDKAYYEIQRNGQKYMDQKFGFNYKNQWSGERNLWPTGNAFVGVSLSDLKRQVTQAYTEAGFVLRQDTSQGEKVSPLELIFNFPMDAEKIGGVVYKIRFLNQFGMNDVCYPCEVAEIYDPHQQLPAAGILGIPDRLTLESRFIAGRARAYEQLKTQAARYLRPRTVFLIPSKPAPLGSPRVVTPMVVT
jgi:hypothetical protein